ncbi:peptidylprolyl isomerase [Nonlabens tegetincola]|uniref:peptidylprolyl isomerase n=1 Tax=Nonlabens tegetincola TaxID=323273 RepID=UPI000CF47609|nr:peptidylprolyl isomerase [Nonlabens tegetincola]PQJ20498.1 peptidylprolyl isomerase [Nonlabens tegetincola]
MAILQQIRSRGVILILVIALALFAFIVQGALTSSDQKQETSIGYVGDVEINQTDFAQKVENMSRNMGPSGSTVQAVNSVWNSEVRNAVLSEQMEAAGIQVTDAQVRDQVRSFYESNPQFQNADGTFNEGAFKTYEESFLQNDPQTWKNYLNDVRSNLRQEKFFELLKSGFVGTNAEARMDYLMENEQRSFNYVQIPYTTIADSTVEVSKSEIESYIASHSKEFQTEAQRDLQMVLFADVASDSDKEAIKNDLAKRLRADSVYNSSNDSFTKIPAFNNAKDVQQYVNQYSEQSYSSDYLLESRLPTAVKPIISQELGTTFGPYEDRDMMKVSLLEDKKSVMDSVQNRHILVAYQGAQRAAANITRSKEEAKAVADSIFNLIGQNKGRFDSKFEYFEENTNIAKAEDIGWVTYSGNARNFAEGFRNFLYDNDKGTIGIAESSFGYHIIRIDDTAAPVDLYKIASISKAVKPSKATTKAMRKEAIKFQQAAVSGDFTETAKEFKKTTTPVTSIKPMDETLPLIQKNREVVRWAFNEETEVGDMEKFDTPQGVVIVKVTRASEAGNMSSEEASATVTPILRNKKKAEMIMAKISNNDINAIAKAQGQSVRSAASINRKNPTIPGAGQEPVVVGTAFGLSKGTTSSPIAGEKGVYVINLTGISEAPELENFTSQAKLLADTNANQASSKLVEALKKKVDIVDNRKNFY